MGENILLIIVSAIMGGLLGMLVGFYYWVVYGEEDNGWGQYVRTGMILCAVGSAIYSLIHIL